MSVNQPQATPVAPSEGGAARSLRNSALILCGMFLVSFIAGLACQSLTKTVPAWLLWLQVGLLTALNGLGIFDELQEWRIKDKIERGLYFVSEILSPLFLYGAMLFISTKTSEKMHYFGIVFLINCRPNTFPFARLGRQTDRQKT